jgi:hypothetical protein
MTLQVCRFEQEKERREDIARHLQKSLRRGEGTGYFDQSVVGSNPTDNESCRSSMAEQRHPEPLIPAAKIPMW